MSLMNPQQDPLVFVPISDILFALISHRQNKSSTKMHYIKLQKCGQRVTQNHCILLTVTSFFFFSYGKAHDFSLISDICLRKTDSYYYYYICHPDLKLLEKYFWN